MLARPCILTQVSASLFGLWAVSWQANPSDTSLYSFESQFFIANITTLPFLFCLRISNKSSSGEY